MIWHIKKICRTIRGCFEIFCARIFGQYRETGWNGKTDYHLYTWRGRDYYIPVQRGELH